MKLETLIGMRIREAREAAGLSQEALGVLVEIEEATAKVRIHQYEQNKHAPPLSMIEKIARVLDKPTEWFFSTDDLQETLLRLHKLQKPERAEALNRIKQILHDRLAKSP
jgi:transcriptional regulator with XRE-family HTH domain